ncbi:MAG: hypothetical protein ACK5HR_03130 [Mycoplasmatales bacterium]
MKNTIETRNIVNNFDIKIHFIDRLFTNNKVLANIKALYKMVTEQKVNMKFYIKL